MACQKPEEIKGTLCYSGNYMNDKYVLVSEGRLRTIERPKKKKIKHLILRCNGFRDIILGENMDNSNIANIFKILQAMIKEV